MDSAITADQLVEKAKAQRKSDRCEDALRTATRATEIEPENAEAWWQVALNTRDLRGSKAALAALRRTTELAPHFAYGWTLLGQTLLEVDKPKSARVCFERAIRANPEEHNALLELAEIYRTSEESDRELDVLQTLDRLDLLDGWRLNRLGILHHQAHRFYKAIDCYKRVAALDDGPAGLFNLGLAYKEISQDADAIDCWRRCVTRYPDYARAGESLRGALPRMVALAAKVRERKIDLLDDSQRYSHYINPFELLNLPRGSDVDPTDVKLLQKHRKALLQELELEDGCVHWMRGLRIDRSRAIGLCDELNHPHFGPYHRLVFADSKLLSFLSRGDVSHFTVDEAESPLGTLELLESPPAGFQEWLDESFANQFDLVFSSALEQRNLLAIEVLLDGRRWVSLSAADRCFRSAFRQVDRMLDPLRQFAPQAATTKPSLKRIQDILAHDGFGRILTLLPLDFHAFHDEAVGLLRDVAVAAYNVHDDAELAQQTIRICLDLPFKSVVLKHKLHDDVKQLDELIAEERKHEVRLTIGSERFEITKGGARRGNTFIPAEHIDSLRWGTVVTRIGHTVVYDFSFVLAGRGDVVSASWKSSEGVEEQKAMFGRIVQAAMHYILPGTVDALRKRLTAGQRIGIGPVTATTIGVEFAKAGWLFSKSVSIPWKHVTTDFGDGDLIIGDARLADPQIRLPLHATDNAIALHFLASVLQGD